MEPLRLALVSMHTSPVDAPGSGDAGGMNVVERHQAEALADLGHQVDLVTRRSDRTSPDKVELRDGVTLHILPAGPPVRLAKSLVDQYIEEFSAAFAEIGGHDLIHSHHWMSGMAALPVAREQGVPHVQSFHSVAAHADRPLSEGEPPESPDRVAGEHLMARESDAVAAISAAEARTVVERCGADPDKVVIVSPGVDHDRFRPLHPDEERWSWGDDDAAGDPNGYVLFAARLQPLKAPDLALRALAHVEKWMRPHLVLAGDTAEDFGAYDDQLRELVHRLGLDDDVTFVGPQSRDQLAAMVRGALIVLVPSHSETFGLIALEAASSGVPVIAASAGGLREAVAHRETGHLIDSREPEDWGRAMTIMLSSEGLIERMGVVARIHARRFEWSWAGRRLEALYRDLIARHA